MIDYQEARRLVLQRLAAYEAESRRIADLRKSLSSRERGILGLGSEESDFTELTLVEDATISGDFGWAFFYQSRAYLESGDFSDMLAGNAPIIVSKFDGSLHETGTAHSVEFYIQNFERTGNPYGEE